MVHVGDEQLLADWGPGAAGELGEELLDETVLLLLPGAAVTGLAAASAGAYC